MRAPDTDAYLTAERRMALARERDDLLTTVRGLDGFAEFLRPPRLTALLPAAADGPIAIINVSASRCDALLVRVNGVQPVHLPHLSLDAVIDHTNDYLRVLHQVDQAAHDLHTARKEVESGPPTPGVIRRYSDAKRTYQRATVDRDDTLDALLRWLWDTTAEPILTALGFTGRPARDTPLPRLWWCPTGPLTMLPLHAAGHHDPERPAGRSVLDRVVSSYTPTLRALVEARRPLRPQPANDRILVVSLPDTPDEAPLTNVERERNLLAALFPDQHTLLEGEHATAATVLEELPRHRWAHFSCHGGQDLRNPSHGGLILHDRTLTVADLAARQHAGEFAFLSACMTAVGGITLPDEAITLAAALHYTGYRQVIGTLWSVHDQTAADVAEAVYAHLTVTGTFTPHAAARALHVAVRQLRDSAHLPMGAWTPFTHTGP
ncbi:CHAT domain-containing protein [Micromonospora arborensis]|uniref:CHAT domain-containing protein n=1 Tax=Micromonospora arborensis TaxID=2116518 RepID=UPI0033C3A45E